MTSSPDRASMGEFLTPPRHRRLLVTLTLTVIGALIAGLFAWAPWGRSSPTATPTMPSPSGSTTTPVSTPTPTASSPATGRRVLVRDDIPVGTGPVVLPRGRSRVGAIRTGYPRTTRGAVAAAIEYAGHSGCLDTTCVNALVRAAADPDWGQARQEYLTGMRNSRSFLGIPANTRAPAGATMAASPMAFQIVPIPRASTRSDEASAPRVRVLLLTYLAAAGPAISPNNTTVVMSVTLRWSHRDWKLSAGDGTSYAHLTATPGTPHAAATGWREYLS